MKTITGYLKPYIGRMILGFIVKVLGTFMDLGLPWVLAYMIDEVIPQNSYSLIALWGVVMLILAVGARVFNVKANQMASKVGRDTIVTIRHDLFVRIQNLSGRQLDYFGIPSLISRMSTDTYNIHSTIGRLQRLGVRAPIILIGGIVITFTMEPVLTLILLACLPIIGCGIWLISRKGLPMYQVLKKKIDSMVRVVRENITGVRVIKALSKNDYERRRFQGVNEAVCDQEFRAGRTMGAMNPMMNMVLNGALTVMIVLGAYRVNAGHTEVGTIMAFLSYFTMILNAVMSINRIFIDLSKSTASASRIREVLNTPFDQPVREIPQEDSPYHIEFRDVSFSYNPHDEAEEVPDCLSHISFALKKGESLGIIGSTGCGKTTIINLLMRFYDVDQGDVLIEGRNVQTFELAELRKHFGVVFQNDVLFADTIFENINFGRGLTREEVTTAAEYAQALPFIENLSKGFDSEVAAMGTNFSGGQKQRMLISRALAAHPEILILDDSSSALDYKTDASLRKALREHFTGTTSIIVAQRISSIYQCDHVMVLEDGQCVGYGTHEELMENCEIYREIHESQMRAEA